MHALERVGEAPGGNRPAIDPDALGERLDGAGFSMVRRWIEPLYRYGLFLLQRR